MDLQEKRLFVAMELSNKKWMLGFGNGSAERFRTITARDQKTLKFEVKRAKEKLGLPPDCKVVCCYEAGRDGFWIDRMLKQNGYENFVMDPASIEVPRRARKKKTDRLDVKKLLKILLRRELWGELDAFSVVCIPSKGQEAETRIHRERGRLVKERTGHRGRMKSLLALHGILVGNPARAVIADLKDWDGKKLPSSMIAELIREQERLRQVEAQIKLIEQQQAAGLADPQTQGHEKAVKLKGLKSVGLQTSWILSHECFAWRKFANRKKVGSFVGLTGTPHSSGDLNRELGISKAGSARLRALLIELAWGWVRWQPESALTKWYIDKYVRTGNKRGKKVGIVALARKLLVALWKYIEFDIVPEGAIIEA